MTDKRKKEEAPIFESLPCAVLSPDECSNRSEGHRVSWRHPTLSVVFTGFSVDQAPLRSGAAGESTSGRQTSLLNLENLGLALKHQEFPPSRIMKSHLTSAAIGVRDTGSRGENPTVACALKSQQFHQGSCL